VNPNRLKYDDFILPYLGAVILILEGEVIGFPYSFLGAIYIM